MLFTEVDPSSYFLDSSVFYSYHHVFCMKLSTNYLVYES